MRPLIALWVFLPTGFVLGQMQMGNPAAPSPINTDRPAFTDSSVVVPQGDLQFENGLQLTGESQESPDLPETLLRFGVGPRTELRFTAPDYYVNSDSGSGFGDLAVGVKQQLGPIAGFDVSIVAAVSMPTGAGTISSHGYDPQFQVPWSRQLSPSWMVAGMFSIYAPTEGSSRNVTGQGTFLLDRQITKPWDAFVEYAGSGEQRGGPQEYIHFGTAYKLGLQQQLDFHVGFGVSGDAVGHFFGFGYSFRFQAIHRGT